MGYNCRISAAHINAIPGINPINNLIAKIAKSYRTFSAPHMITIMLQGLNLKN